MSDPIFGPPMLGLAEAAKACNVSLSTIRRRRAELLAMGATSDARGWRIPIPALIELGLMDRTTAPDDTPQIPRQSASVPGMTPVMTPPSDTPSDTSELLEELRSQLAKAEQRAAVAEAVAAERERVINAQAQALRMLEAGPSRSRFEPEAPETLEGPSGTPSDMSVAPVMTPPNDSPMAPSDTPVRADQRRERPALRLWPWSRKHP